MKPGRRLDNDEASVEPDPDQEGMAEVGRRVVVMPVRVAMMVMAVMVMMGVRVHLAVNCRRKHRARHA